MMNVWGLFFPRAKPGRSRRSTLSSNSRVAPPAHAEILHCADKTGTLTRNELAVPPVTRCRDFDEAEILVMAALASSDGGADPLDAAIRTACTPATLSQWKLVAFTPFDPARKMSEAVTIDANGNRKRIVKGAFSAVAGIAEAAPPAAAMVEDLQARGFRVLAVAVGLAEARALPA